MLKVIGAGFGRTGTSSLQVALEELLGGRCYHMKDIMIEPAQLQVWHDFAVGKTPVMDWKRLFEDYTAVVDCPVCMYYEELMEVFPEAGVILTVRDPQHWWKSFNCLMSIVDKARLLRFLAPKLRKVSRFTDKIIIQDVFEGRMEKEHCIRIFEMHNDRVREVVPETPFPRLNAGKRSLYKMFGKTLFNDFMSR